MRVNKHAQQREGVRIMAEWSDWFQESLQMRFYDFEQEWLYFEGRLVINPRIPQSPTYSSMQKNNALVREL
jgi:hypothetical protein